MDSQFANPLACSDDAALALARLLEQRAPHLAGWYAHPQDRAMAGMLAASAREELRTRLCTGGACFQLHVLMLACDFHRGADCGVGYSQLAASTRNRRENALLELVYGQLLISRKCIRATAHLERGFSLAAGYLATKDYFRLVRRHELLLHLPLSAAPADPAGLESLLREAAVIKRLQAGAGRVYEHAHRDTLG